MGYSSEILLWATLSSTRCDRHAEFPSTFDSGCCHLCHQPVQETAGNAVCLHWLANDHASASQLHAMLQQFGVSEALQYLALSTAAARMRGYGSAPYGCARDADHVVIKFHLRDRHYAFRFKTWTARECEVEFYSTRSRARARITVDLFTHEQRLLQRLQAWSDLAPLPRFLKPSPLAGRAW